MLLGHVPCLEMQQDFFPQRGVLVWSAGGLGLDGGADGCVDAVLVPRRAGARFPLHRLDPERETEGWLARSLILRQPATGNRQTESVLTDQKSLRSVDAVNTSRVAREASGIGHVE